jgi:hypothetical protein
VVFQEVSQLVPVPFLPFEIFRIFSSKSLLIPAFYPHFQSTETIYISLPEKYVTCKNSRTILLIVQYPNNFT